VADPIRILIVDDEPLAIERMTRLCAAIPGTMIAGTANDGAQALTQCGALAPDIVLLDISMPEIDGMAVARALTRNVESRIAIIFVTAFDSFAIEAFDLAAVDYLLKPVAPDRLALAIERARVRLDEPTPAPAATNHAREFWVPYRSELIRVSADDIERVDAERDYMRFHLGERSYLIHMTISALEERLDPARFIRLHRSVIVRRDRIARLAHDRAGAWHAELVDGQSVRIGRTYLAAAKALAGR
jgi:two-component system, LytTR family, response regulator AlgR